ncbi:MAG: hypothetical protein CME25_00545 [Gemmatimonadetes bacterium]|nr:hypothetical protein [Gemmatimonadota bacterium]|tara:strand:+ start:4368 stop:5756 length:1389 start_codon:yes stop_codon:yes gene_type:complete
MILDSNVLSRLVKQDVADPFALAQPELGNALLSTIAGERASQGPGNKIVSADGKTHFVWQDSLEQRYFARARTYNHGSGEWTLPATLSEGIDEHSRPTLAIDSKGYLHVVMGGHNSPLQYNRSRDPHDTSAWTEAEPFGKNTYPVLLAGPDDTLILTVRDGTHSGMELWTKPDNGSWQSDGLLVARQDRFSGYTAMSNDMAWGPHQQALHMSQGFFLSRRPAPDEHARDVAGLYQAIGYLRSLDSGLTWHTTAGTKIALPGSSDTVDLLEEDESNNPKPGINHCGLAIDSRNRPYVGYLRHTPEPCSAFLKTQDESGTWQDLQLVEAIASAWPGYGASRFKPVFTEDDVLCILAEIVPIEHPNANWNPGIYGLPDFWLRDYPELSRLVWLESSDYGRNFTTREPIADVLDKGQLLPSVERPNGRFPIPAGTRPSFLYTLGDWRYANEGETIDNELYWVRMEP